MNSNVENKKNKENEEKVEKKEEYMHLGTNLTIAEMNEKLIEIIKENVTNLRPWIELDNFDDDSIAYQFQMTTEKELMPDYSDNENIIFNNVISKEKYLLTLFEAKPPLLNYFSQDFENIFYSKNTGVIEVEDVNNRLIRQSFNEYNDFCDICDIISIEDIENDFE